MSKSFASALADAIRTAELEDMEVADRIGISHGYMSRFLRRVGDEWASRLVRFMVVTNNTAPLQWLANEMGCDLAPRAGQAARIAELQAELAALTRRRTA